MRNRTTYKAVRWVEEFGGRNGLNPKMKLLRTATLSSFAVGNDDDLRSVVLGENGAFAGMKRCCSMDDTTDSSHCRTGTPMPSQRT